MKMKVYFSIGKYSFKKSTTSFAYNVINWAANEVDPVHIRLRDSEVLPHVH